MVISIPLTGTLPIAPGLAVVGGLVVAEKVPFNKPVRVTNWEQFINCFSCEPNNPTLAGTQLASKY